jgi:hypothetical protein
MANKIQTSTIIDFAHGRLSPSESLGLLESIEMDPRASEELDLVVDLMNEAADPDSVLFVAPATPQRPFLVRAMRAVIEGLRNHPFLYPVGAFGCLVATLGIVIGISLLSSNRFGELTGIDRTAFTWNARGTDNSDIAGAYICFTNGDYEKSLSLLDRYLRGEPHGELAPYVDYTAGAVCLIASRHNYLNVFETRDAKRVEEALQYLSLAITRSSNPRLLEESRFLRAKGFLMLNRPADAIAELETVRSLGGPRCDEAKQIIERIHALTP